MKKYLPLNVLSCLALVILLMACEEKEEPVPELPVIEISSVSPYSGYGGDEVRISGKGFSADVAENTVKFNGTEAAIQSASESRLVVIVPEEATTGKISVTVKGHTVMSSLDFTVFRPEISGFSPDNAYPEDRVIISGSNFSPVAEENEVKFNGYSAVVNWSSKTELEVTVPVGQGSGKVTVLVDGRTAISNDNFTFAPDHWTQKADFSGPQDFGIAFTIGNKAYVGIGRLSSKAESSYPVTELWEYEPASDVWTQKADFPGTARCGAVAFSIGSSGYVGAGNGGIHCSDPLNDFWQYHAPTDEWSRIEDFGGPLTNEGVGFSIEGKGYVVTGNSSQEFWQYDPVKRAWSKKSDFPGEPRQSATGFVIAGKGYVGTGSSYSFLSLKDFWEYDPASGSWTRKADLEGHARTRAVAFSINSKGYIGGGIWGFHDERKREDVDFWEFDPATDTWARKANLKDRCFSAMSFSIYDKGYIVGGFYSRDFWEYSLE